MRRGAALAPAAGMQCAGSVSRLFDELEDVMILTVRGGLGPAKGLQYYHSGSFYCKLSECGMLLEASGEGELLCSGGMCAEEFRLLSEATSIFPIHRGKRWRRTKHANARTARTTTLAISGMTVSAARQKRAAPHDTSLPLTTSICNAALF